MNRPIIITGPAASGKTVLAKQLYQIAGDKVIYTDPERHKEAFLHAYRMPPGKSPTLIIVEQCPGFGFIKDVEDSLEKIKRLENIALRFGRRVVCRVYITSDPVSRQHAWENGFILIDMSEKPRTEKGNTIQADMIAPIDYVGDEPKIMNAEDARKSSMKNSKKIDRWRMMDMIEMHAGMGHTALRVAKADTCLAEMRFLIRLGFDVREKITKSRDGFPARVVDVSWLHNSPTQPQSRDASRLNPKSQIVNRK